MANHIHLYKDNPTAGGVDGTMVSEGDGSNPVIVGPLNATANEISSDIKLALRCDTGYQTLDDVIITPTGSTATMWSLAPDNAGSPGTYETWGASLTIPSGTVIGDTNYIIWARARALDTEQDPVNDVSVMSSKKTSIL